MTVRSLVIGIIVILAAGVAAALLMRSEQEAAQPDDAATAEIPVDTTVRIPTEPPTEDAVRTELLGIGTEAPAFELERLDGGTFSLEDHRGQVVLINFWATWCEPCRDEMPDLQQLWEAHKDDGLVVAGVSLDEDGRELVKEFHETFPVEYPLLLDGMPVAVQYGAQYAVPTSYLVDRSGRIVERHVGAMTREEFEPHVTPFL